MGGRLRGDSAGSPNQFSRAVVIAVPCHADLILIMENDVVGMRISVLVVVPLEREWWPWWPGFPVFP